MKYTIKARPVTKNEPNGYGFIAVVGRPRLGVSLDDLCDIECVDYNDVQGIDRLEADLLEQYEAGTWLELSIVKAN
jgi:hypothetical protein